MRTAEEMYEYAVKNGYTLEKRGLKKHFKLIEDTLRDDEEVYMAFTGIKYEEVRDYAFAITNERIIFARKRWVTNIVKSVVLDKLNDISHKEEVLLGVLVLDTLGEIIVVKNNKKIMKNIAEEVQRIIFDMRRGELSNQSNESQKNDRVDEIRKYKELMDEGIISEEEFDKKKNELLGL